MTDETNSSIPIQKMAWKPSYSVGYASMDRQHQLLFDIINGLIASQNEPLSKNELTKIFNELRTYTDAHFQAEEKLMELNSYPGLDEHRRAHGQYYDSINVIEERMHQGVARVDLELLDFLNSWWIHHVQDLDQGYARRPAEASSST